MGRHSAVECYGVLQHCCLLCAVEGVSDGSENDMESDEGSGHVTPCEFVCMRCQTTGMCCHINNARIKIAFELNCSRK